MKKALLILNMIFACICITQAQAFNEFWLRFQKDMNNTEALIKQIDFPYYYSCNYLGDGEITKQQFSKDGPIIFVNGNAFISRLFNEGNYPTIESLSIFKFNNGYLNEYLKTAFLNKFGNLNDIYVISEKGNENEAIGYKAYFRKNNTSFAFIGFEGYEQGD
jgi:hypothetical protein